MGVFSKETFQRMMSSGKKTTAATRQTKEHVVYAPAKPVEKHFVKRIDETEDDGKKDELRQVEVYDCQIGRVKDLLEEYHSKLKALNVSEEDKMAAVQVALDLTYIKEELDEVCQNLNQDTIHQIQVRLDELSENHDQELLSLLQKLDGRQQDLLIRIVNMDHTVGDPIKKELQETREELAASQNRLEGKVDKSMGFLKGMLFASLLLNLVAAGGIVYCLLTQFGIL